MSADEIRDRFAANLVRIRRAERMSQEELAVRASLHRCEISLLERSKRAPRMDTLVKLAAALGTDPNSLLDGIHWVVPPPSGRGAFTLSRRLRAQ
jgi:transcriptional regulator with XRE-family HTH domain